MKMLRHGPDELEAQDRECRRAECTPTDGEKWPRAICTGPLFVVCLVCSLLLGACSRHVSEPEESTFRPAPPTPVDPGPATLLVTDDVVGKGKEARAGDTVRVHYTGTLMNGTKFDSSRDRGKPFDFKLGTGAVIKGWDQGVAGMRVGGKRRLVIPEALGYGEEGSPPTIPPKAGLKFEVELLEVNPTSTTEASSAAPADPGVDLGQEPPEPPEDETP